MPLAVDSLTAKSSPQAIQNAISQSIEQCMKEGTRSQKECAGMAYGIAREKTGKELSHGKAK